MSQRSRGHDAAAPPVALAQGEAEADGFLVVVDGVGHPADPEAGLGALGGELGVLGNGAGVPAAHPFQHFPAEAEAGAYQLGGQAAGRTGTVPDQLKADVVQPVASGYGAGGRISRPRLGFADHRAGGESVVHPGQVVGFQHVVRVEDQKGVIAEGHQLGESMVERAALAGHGTQAVENVGSRRPGRGLCEVGAVVGDHVDIAQFGGIVLTAQAVDQVADDGFLIPGGNDHGETGLGRSRGITLPPE